MLPFPYSPVGRCCGYSFFPVVRMDTVRSSGCFCPIRTRRKAFVRGAVHSVGALCRSPELCAVVRTGTVPGISSFSVGGLHCDGAGRSPFLFRLCPVVPLSLPATVCAGRSSGFSALPGHWTVSFAVGRLKRNSRPPSRRSFTVMVPPCRLTMFLTIDSPSPEPPASRVRPSSRR